MSKAIESILVVRDFSDKVLDTVLVAVTTIQNKIESHINKSAVKAVGKVGAKIVAAQAAILDAEDKLVDEAAAYTEAAQVLRAKYQKDRAYLDAAHTATCAELIAQIGKLTDAEAAAAADLAKVVDLCDLNCLDHGHE
jgi:hypothetical protein